MKSEKLAVGIVAVSFLLLTGFTAQSDAGVNVNVGIFAPPLAYEVPAPPPMVVIPGTYVYAVPDGGVNMLFYHGYWWRPYEGRWYRSARYNDSWAYVRSERVPRAVIELPPDYHRHFASGPRIAHEDMQRNWKSWERDRYWDRQGDRRERHEERREHGDRGDREERHGERDRF